jgi:hypothetical protein
VKLCFRKDGASVYSALYTEVPMRSFAGRCLVLCFLALFPAAGFADEVAVCEVVAVDETGVVTAQEVATGTTFEFKPPKAALRNLSVGAPLEADIDARIVLVGDQRVRMRSLRRGEGPPKSSGENAPAENADAYETETPRRSVTQGPVVKQRRAEASETSPEESESGGKADAGEAQTPPRSVTASDPGRSPKTGRPAIKKSGQTSAPPGKTVSATSKASVPSTQSPVKPRSRRQLGGGLSTPPSGTPNCYATGCSGQICADRDVITTCQSRPEYACYRSAQCTRQADGACGWTETAELQACLQNPPAQ